MTHQHSHKPPAIAPSILRLSLWQRVGAVTVVIALMWAAMFWAMS
jgi:hypothetical protein